MHLFLRPRGHLLLALALLLPGTAATTPQAGRGASDGAGDSATARTLDAGFTKKVLPFLNAYCVDCHGGKKPEAELDLGVFRNVELVARHPAAWELVLDRLESGDMPPDDAKRQPRAAARKEVAAWVKAMRAHEARRNAGDPGPVLARRLSNAEYDHTIRDLTGVDLRPTREFPVDPANEAGFDNSGESLAMSPGLVSKYLDAARRIADHLVFTPDGFIFAPYPARTDVDFDKFAVHRVVDFYRRQSLDYVDFFAAAWRFHHRAELGRPDATLKDVAVEARLSPKYLGILWAALHAPDENVGPLAAIQARWRDLPTPVANREPVTLRRECEEIRFFITQVRPMVKREFPNLVSSPSGRVGKMPAPGSQAMVMWKNKQYAANRRTYPGNALKLDWSRFAASDPALAPPADDAGRIAFEESFRRFCAIFPDAFYIAERGRMFIPNKQINAEDLEGRRLLSAGFHSQMGYFRDDGPLYDMVLNAEEQLELDRLWRELDFIARVPFRQFKQFVWFERAEPPSFMIDSVFNEFRSEDPDLISEAKVMRLAKVFHAVVEERQKSIPATRQYHALALEAVRDYFTDINAAIRALEQAQRDAEPRQLDALLRFAGRAYRRPLSDEEGAGLIAFYRTLRGQELSHEDALRDAVVGVLLAPEFLYRTTVPDKEGAAVAAGWQQLSGYELASRLSYFLWASMPDDELLARAAAGDLQQPAVLVAQARRLLRDGRVRGLATEFAGNWLDIRRFEEHNAVDRERFPAFTSELRQAMFEEPIRYFVDLVQRNGSVLDFIFGEHTFVNPVLARHYGIPADSQPPAEWRRVDAAGQYQRGGLLPMAAFLTKNAPGLRTSPVKRGYWVVTRLLGERIPAPPPDVPVLAADETKLGELTLREALARHRADKSCASCHHKFDSFGLVFEGFGPVGETRTIDLAGRPAETAAVFPDGSQGTGLGGLRTYLREKAEKKFLENLCRKLLVYALGRSLLPSDDLLITAMIERLARDAHRFESIVDEIVTSLQFLTKRNPATSPL